jgi:Tol biopolymer transport system component
VGRSQPNQKNFSRFAHSKSARTYLGLSLLSLFIAFGCSSKKSKYDSSDLVHFDSLEGEIHQLTTLGENTQTSFSPTFNKLVFVRTNTAVHKTPQIYIKNMIDKSERRLTYNLGANFYPHFHPNKSWIAYSSSSDELVEKINVEPVMKDLGIKKTNSGKPAATPSLPLEVYVTNEDGSDIKRITHNRGFDSLAVFSSDGEKLYYVTQADKNWQIVQSDLKTGQKRMLLSLNEPITSISLSPTMIAYTTDKKLFIKKIHGQESIYESPEGFFFAGVELYPKEDRVLVVSNFADKKNKDIYELDLTKKCTTRLTFHPADESSPTFGPEGKSLFFVSNRSQSQQIYSTLIREGLPCKIW